MRAGVRFRGLIACRNLLWFVGAELLLKGSHVIRDSPSRVRRLHTAP